MSYILCDVEAYELREETFRPKVVILLFTETIGSQCLWFWKSVMVYLYEINRDLNLGELWCTRKPSYDQNRTNRARVGARSICHANRSRQQYGLEKTGR